MKICCDILDTTKACKNCTTANIGIKQGIITRHCNTLEMEILQLLRNMFRILANTVSKG